MDSDTPKRQKLATALTQQHMNAIGFSTLTNACVCGRERQRVKDGEREGRLWPAARTPRNWHKLVMWLQSGTTILFLYALSSSLPPFFVLSEKATSPHIWKKEDQFKMPCLMDSNGITPQG